MAAPPPAASAPPVEPTAPSRVEQATAAVADASLKAVMEKLAAKGPEYEALAEIARPIIEAVVWEVVPDLAEAIILDNPDKFAK